MNVLKKIQNKRNPGVIWSVSRERGLYETINMWKNIVKLYPKMQFHIFGIKEFDLTEPHMKAKERLDANWGLRKYNSMCDSVEDYMNLLSTSYKYEEFQELLLMQWFKNKVDLFALVDTLYNYAENPEYEKEIKNLITKLEDM